jgi:hypothetical protein
MLSTWFRQPRRWRAAFSIYAGQRYSPMDSAKSIAAAADWLAQAKRTAPRMGLGEGKGQQRAASG